MSQNRLKVALQKTGSIRRIRYLSIRLDSLHCFTHLRIKCSAHQCHSLLRVQYRHQSFSSSKKCTEYRDTDHGAAVASVPHAQRYLWQHLRQHLGETSWTPSLTARSSFLYHGWKVDDWQPWCIRFFWDLRVLEIQRWHSGGAKVRMYC